MFLLGSGGFGRASPGGRGGALEITATACSEPPVRSKSLLQPARGRLCARNHRLQPVRSRLCTRNRSSKMLGAITLCSALLDSVLLCTVHVYARVHTSIYIYIL